LTGQRLGTKIECQNDSAWPSRFCKFRRPNSDQIKNNKNNILSPKNKKPET
jgi:hypothetical protein